MKSKGGGWSDNRRQFQRPASIGRWAMSESGEDELTGFRTFRPHRQEKDPTL